MVEFYDGYLKVVVWRIFFIAWSAKSSWINLIMNVLSYGMNGDFLLTM